MVSQLFDPTQPKNASDAAIVGVLVFMGFMFWILPQWIRPPIFAIIFLFWRLAYNAGIGWLLWNQSKHRRLTSWARKSGIFEDPANGNNKYPFLYNFLAREMEAKIPKDYTFSEAPLEYNTWLLFRRVVDLILMSDFTSYCLFAFACGGRPAGERWLMTVARWSGGWMLVLFNLWVKLDAHRVVKDFAWYWGDFFYLIDQDLTFDGVFELAPHPMYSVGYAGFYGISMMAASYRVLFISIIAHAAQLIFLHYVETPHIEKTYNAPPPVPKRSAQSPEATDRSRSQSTEPLETLANSEADRRSPSPSDIPPASSALDSVSSLDLHRITDVAVILLHVYLCSAALLTPSTWLWQTLFVFNAVVWRLWFSLGLGYLLDRQSNKKSWTRHFVKYGETSQEAWRQWKGVYHISMTMCYTSFACATWKMYGLPQDWSIGMAILRHIIGAALVLLQIWTALNIYESLGEFGWFFGDFFFENQSKLNYSGIYRFLNNPERTIGLAGIWGAAILTWSKTIFLLALLSHALTLFFIQFIERPHMQKLYRNSVRGQSGVSRSIQRSLPAPLQKWTGSVDRVLDGGLDFVEECIDAAGPKLAAGLNTVVADSKKLLKQFPARLSLNRLNSGSLKGFDPKDYLLVIDANGPGISQSTGAFSGREGENAQRPQERRDDFGRLTVEYGAPVRLSWSAPANHSSKDWIGLYRVGDNASRDVTKVASQGRWVATNPGVHDYHHADAGILVSEYSQNDETGDGNDKNTVFGLIEFSGDKLWWTQGVFEFRYHHDGKYNVMATSLPFEICINRFDEDDVELDANGQMIAAVENELLTLVQNCFDRHPDLAPRSAEETFGSALERNGKYAKRVVYAVKQMFGIEFAPEVVRADGNVRRLAWRICSAKKVLAPYSMSRSKGRSTPT